jgi:hypothetical protein
MANRLTNEELKRLARLGALARLKQLEEERRTILRAFPGLIAETGHQAPTAGRQSGEDAPGAPKKKARKRRKMTAAEKRAASERMLKYWAAKKQG